MKRLKLLILLFITVFCGTVLGMHLENILLFEPTELNKQLIEAVNQFIAPDGDADPEKIRDLVKKGANPSMRMSGWMFIAPDVTILHQSVVQNSELTKVLLDLGADVNAKGFLGRTPLHQACQADRGINPAADLLLKAGADINARDANGWTPLFHAANVVLDEVNVEMVDFLIKHGAALDVRDNRGWTVLHYAVKNLGSKDAHVIKKLVESGCNPHTKEQYGRTPYDLLFNAAKKKAFATALGITVEEDETDYAALALLYRAASRNDQNEVERLLQLGVDPNKVHEEENLRLSGFNAFDEAGREEESGETVLHHMGSKRVASLLIEHGADVNALDVDERTPLNVPSENGYLDIVKLLLQHGADPNRGWGYHTFDNPLTGAVSYGHAEVVGALLDAGGRMDNIMHYASINDVYDIVKLLCDRGFDINTKNFRGFTPLQEAVFWNSYETAALLLTCGADPNVRNDFDVSAWTMLAGNLSIHRDPDEHDSGSRELAQTMLKHGVNINEQFSKRRTHLHVAAKQGDVETFEFLINHGADPSIKNAEGKTPLDLAHPEVREEMEAIVSKRGLLQRFNVAVRGAISRIRELFRRRRK